MVIFMNKIWNIDRELLQSVYNPGHLQDLLYDIEESLNSHNGAVYFWKEETVVSVLRTEPYQEGVLLFNLETSKDYRQQGYATKLVKAVILDIRKNDNIPVYVHIEKGNIPSLHLHEKIGFQICAEYGKLIDGTVSHRYYTMVYK